MIDIKDRVTASLIVIVPLFILWADVIQAHLFNLYLGAFLCLALSFAVKKNDAGPPNPYLTIFLLYTAAWFAFWLSSHYAGRKSTYIVLVGLDAVLILTAAAIIYREIADSRAPNEFWFNHIRIAVLIQACMAICQYWWFNPVESVLSLVTKVAYSTWGDAHTPAGSLGNANFLGAFIAVPLPLFFHRTGFKSFNVDFSHILRRLSYRHGIKIKIYYPLFGWCYFAPLVAYALYLSHCRTAIIGVLAVVTFWAIRYGQRYFEKRRNRIIYGSAIVAAFIAAAYWFVSRNLLSFIDRYHEFWRGPLNHWISARLDFIITHPVQEWFIPSEKLPNFDWYVFIFGVGPGVSFRANNFLHSEIVPMLQNYGTIGLLIAGAFIVAITRQAWRAGAILFSSLAIILIDALGNHVLHIPATALMCIFIFALIAKSTAEIPALKFATSETQGGLEEALRRR